MENTLRSVLSNAKPLLMLPSDPVIKEVLIPALQHAETFDCMIGYFSSQSFSEIAPGLATYLRENTRPMRLIVSPFLTTEDRVAIEEGLNDPNQIAEKYLFEDIPDANEISQHTLKCLAWLLYQERLQIKIAFMKDALFHSKAWIFGQGENEVALHGSMNFTSRAFLKNREQLTLSRSWKGEEAEYHIQRLKEEFENLWNGGNEDCIVTNLAKAVKHKIIKNYKEEQMPTENEGKKLWCQAYNLANENALEEQEDDNQIPTLSIPDYLEYRQGDYAHQGEAVDSWIAQGYQGILEMATGSGKTITAMIGATKLLEETKNLLVVVSAPYRPLLEQWCEEIAEFGLKPINLSKCSGPDSREREIKQTLRRLRFGNSQAEVLVVTHNTLTSDHFIDTISRSKQPCLLIADECHNLGSQRFISNPPEIFEYRLGLSATPVRQYDQEGTEALIEFFGQVCFQYTLEQAIGNCLAEYDYYVHFVELTEEEMERWYELTNQISALAWKIEEGEEDPKLEDLLRRRRLVLETAKNKINTLEKLLKTEDIKQLKYTLVYTTDKDPKQLEEVNQIFRNKNISFHQLTHEETKSRKQTEKILKSFQEGNIKVITAKRVLDEGINIPQIKLAYILASTTVKRQWIQRRGRLLRKCKQIGKNHALIHDFVTLPPNILDNPNLDIDKYERRLIHSELERIWEFAKSSQNAALKGGGYEAVQFLQNVVN